MKMSGGWIIDLDIRKFFDTLDKNHLREILKKRVRDGVLLRLIGKWLNAGVLEDGGVSYPERGTPQGGVISPILSNIYLHDVLDRWFANEVKPRLKGEAFLIRFADDGAPRAHLNIECGALQKMRVGPSESTYRRRLQTAPSCVG
jgi:retron-type reverse transcriptase